MPFDPFRIFPEASTFHRFVFIECREIDGNHDFGCRVVCLM
jgi:hypothetical protein